MNTSTTTKISTLALACLLLGVGSCSRGDDSLSGDKLLQVNVQMATSSPMLARGVTTSPIISDTVDMGNDLVLVASSQPRQPEEALTRGMPIKSAATLPSMNVKVFNSGSGAFSSSTALTATLKGTNSSGAWSLSPAYVIVDGVKNTYMAYSPIEDAGNGITVAANGRTITYTAPAAVANHPDLCTSTIAKDNVSSNLPLAMQHRLVAVGIKGMGNWVKINSIVLSNVYSSGTLNLETGAWSNLGAKTNFTPVISQSDLSTNGAMNDITAANGYLMLPPQSFTDDNQTITVKYQYLNDGGFPEQTATYRLKDLTGGKWDAGQIVMYEIQLNSYFSLTLNPASLTLGAIAGTASFTYSTNNPSANATKFDNNGNTWITNIQVDRTTKKVTFNYAASIAEGNRNAVIRGTSGFTTKDLGLTQSLIFTTSSTSGGTIAGAGGSATVNVTASSGVAWSVTVSNCTASPTSGTGNGGAQAVTLTIPANPSFTATRAISATFKVTSPVAITKAWSATQEEAPYIEIKGVKWAKGSLVASGANGAKIGAPTDVGLYFQFGSLIGWAGGANGDGTGTGSPALALKVKPTGYTGGTTFRDCGYSSGTIPASGVASTGIGDPCRYYLGSPWRLPTQAEFTSSLCNGIATGTDLGAANAAWQASPSPVGINFNNNSTKLFIPASGYRNNGTGVLLNVGSGGYCWSELAVDGAYSRYLYISSSMFGSLGSSSNRGGYPVRCVQ